MDDPERKKLGSFKIRNEAGSAIDAGWSFVLRLVVGVSSGGMGTVERITLMVELLSHTMEIILMVHATLVLAV